MLWRYETSEQLRLRESRIRAQLSQHCRTSEQEADAWRKRLIAEAAQPAKRGRLKWRPARRAQR